ncbi:MAG: hypothetical protein DI585_02915 [Pseudomonas fluorescens]|nr:MAG: hypothetical protein DI585_02915 [Pseudomonas fluorescens]
MSYHILYESSPWHTRCALFDDHGRLLTLRYDEASRRHIDGALAYGRVRMVVPSLGAAFVDIGDVHDALLPFNAIPEGMRLTEGQAILARITRGGFEEKGARLDARTANKMPSSETPCPSLIQNPPSALKRALQDAGSNPVTVWINGGHQRDAVTSHVPESRVRQLNMDDTQFGSESLTDTLDNCLDAMSTNRPTFPFAGKGISGNLIIELTSAVATIDVNASPSSYMNKQDATMAVNLRAAEEVARLCRLLDLGGSVIVDFITPKSKNHRGIIAEHLLATFNTTDDRFVELRPMSRHGLLELTRERSGPSLTLLLKTAPYIAGRIGLELWRTPAGANPKLRTQTVTAHPDVITHLQKYLTQAACLMHLGRPITLQADGAMPLTRYSISG